MKWRYKIVEYVDGNGISTFSCKYKFLYFWLLCQSASEYGDDSIFDDIETANSFIQRSITSDNSRAKTKKEEYYYSPIPKHIPPEQVKNFLRVNAKKERTVKNAV
jgi:hypothetical protein